MREFVLVWHWRDGGNPTSHPVRAANRLGAYLRALRTTELGARGGLRAIDVIDDEDGGRTRVCLEGSRATSVTRRDFQ